jgi:hypothetical protein
VINTAKIPVSDEVAAQNVPKYVYDETLSELVVAMTTVGTQ